MSKILPKEQSKGGMNLDLHEPFVDISASEATALAETHDTPLFVYDEDYFIERVRSFQEIWKDHFPNGKVYLSYKTNYMPRLCRAAHDVGLGADVVSGYELEHAINLNVANRTVFNGPLKRPSELLRAVNMGVGINIDLEEELEALVHLQDEQKISEPRLGLRVNPGRAVYSSRDVSFVDEHQWKQRTAKFGWPLEGGFAQRMADGISRAGFKLRMIHAHLNSQITSADLMLDALRPVMTFARELIDRGFPIEELNIGGGFGIPGMVRARRGWWTGVKQAMGEPIVPEKTEEFDLEDFCSRLGRELKSHNLGHLEICCEPGRYLSSPSMALITRVVGLKVLESKTWLIVDAGLHIMPTASFGEIRRLRFLRGAEREIYLGNDAIECAIGGPLCYEGDVLMNSIQVPGSIQGGDILIISDAGAYTVSRSTNFNQPRAAVAMRDNNNGRIIWERESYDDIFKYSV